MHCNSYLTSTHHSDGVEGVEHGEEKNMIHRLFAHFWYPTRIVRADTIGGPVGRKGKAIAHQVEDKGLSSHLVIS